MSRELTSAAPRLSFGRFALLTTGLVVEGRVTEGEWMLFFNSIRHIGASLQWVLGDWLVYGERTWAKTYPQIAEITGIDVDVLYQYAYVARSVDFSIRIENLSFGHHQLVASLPPDDQARWLRQAADNGWSIVELREALRPPAPVSQTALADPAARRAFHALWRAARRGEAIPAAQLAALRAWLDDLEERLRP